MVVATGFALCGAKRRSALRFAVLDLEMHNVHFNSPAGSNPARLMNKKGSHLWDPVSYGGRYWVRTSDPRRVKAMLSR